jgi:hypothetical protein
MMHYNVNELTTFF